MAIQKLEWKGIYPLRIYSWKPYWLNYINNWINETDGYTVLFVYVKPTNLFRPVVKSMICFDFSRTLPDRNHNAMKISRLVGLNSKAELLLLRSYFLVFPFLLLLSLSLKNMAVICNSALLFIFSYSFSLSYYSTTLQLDGGEW